MARAGREAVAVAILAKAPLPGFAKTRLAASLGVDGAAALQARFIARATETACAAAIGAVTLWAAPDEDHPAFQTLAALFGVGLARQPDGDLGARMLAAPASASAAARRCSGRRAGQSVPITKAGPLIGMRRPQPRLFADMPWSTAGVMAETRRRLTGLSLSWREPARLWDVDRPEDLERLKREGLASLLG